ncbi:ZrgA family zinc uptake protein [Bdellovibrio sp. HCB2-146]|uniref:ZrgA family zinc uptake protein n=1 Tax=Bdellovibrio sp. HCB2-146 TaxID=3394362 RepID=UPI0039BD207B
MISLLLVSFLSMAHADEQKAQKAHVHGEANISIAFDGKKGRMEFHAPSEALFGFEHEARSAKDRAKKDQAMTKLEEKMSEMVVLAPELKCEIKKEISEVIQSKDHGDVDAEFNITCEQPVVGTTVRLQFAKVFPGIKKAKVDVIAGDVQKSVIVKKGGESLELK